MTAAVLELGPYYRNLIPNLPLNAPTLTLPELPAYLSNSLDPAIPLISPGTNSIIDWTLSQSDMLRSTENLPLDHTKVTPISSMPIDPNPNPNLPLPDANVTPISSMPIESSVNQPHNEIIPIQQYCPECVQRNIDEMRFRYIVNMTEKMTSYVDQRLEFSKKEYDARLDEIQERKQMNAAFHQRRMTPVPIGSIITLPNNNVQVLAAECRNVVEEAGQVEAIPVPVRVEQQPTFGNEETTNSGRDSSDNMGGVM